MARMNTGDPLTRQWFESMLLPQDVEAYRQQHQINPGVAPNGGFDGEGNWTGFGPSATKNDAVAKKMIALFDQYGANNALQLPPEVRQQMPNGGLYLSNSPKTFGDQFKDFVTSPAFLMIAGGVGAMYAAPAAAAGAGSAAGSGAAAGGVTGAAGELAAGGAAAYGGGAAAAGSASGAGLSAELAAGAPEAAGTMGLSQGAGAAATTLPGEAGYLGGSGSMTATTGATNTLPGQVAGGTAASGTALSRILGGNGTDADYLQVVGQLGSTALGMYGSKQQADAYADQAARYEAMGQPYRERLGALYSDPTAFLNSPEVKVPVQQGTDALARALSTQGNPAGSGAALQQLQSYASDQLFGKLGQEKDRLAGYGGLTAYNQAAPQLGMNAIGAQGNMYNALGYGIGAVTNPPRSLEDMLKVYNISQGLQ